MSLQLPRTLSFSVTPPQAIIFDLEGVVVDTERVWDEAQRLLLSDYGISYERDRLKHLLSGRSIDDSIDILCATFGLDADTLSLKQELLSIVADRFRHSISFVDGFQSFYALVPSSIQCCIATGMAISLFRVLDSMLDVSGLFNGRVFTTEDAGGIAKPEPDLFQHAARRMQVPYAQCTVIEDSPLGVHAAKRAGMYSVGLATTYEEAALSMADLVVSSYAELNSHISQR